MGDLEPITRNEKLWSGEDLTPVTRKEMYIKHLYDETQVIPEYPVTREEMFILKAGEELHDVTVEQLSVTENGTYSEEGVAYSPVIVNVPAPVLDELTVTENGTYTPPSGTDGYDEVTVNVPLPENAYLLKEIEDVEIASFNDGSDLSMPKLEVAIEPVQEGSGDPSPENIRPIIGWDEVNVTRCGKNWWGKGNINGVSTYDITGLYIPIGTWTLSVVATSDDTDSNKCLIYDLTPSYSGELGSVERGSRKYITFTTNHVITKMRFYASMGYNTSYGDAFTFTDIQIEEGSVATEYEPYGHTYTIDLDGTRYGGKVDLVSGVMTVDRASVKLNDLNWTKQNTSSNNWRFTSSQSIQNIKLPTSVSSKIDNLCSVYQNVTANETWTADKTGIAIEANAHLLICDLNQADTTALGVVIANQTYCYELATPLTIQLTPTVVKSLRGMNNVWADTGNILDLSYLAKEE